MENCIITQNFKIRTPEMCSLEARLKTFENWPNSKKQTPRELAACGFFLSWN